MFRNYLTIALRNIVRHKLYSFINIGGLAVGLACVIFVIPVHPGRSCLTTNGFPAAKISIASRWRSSCRGRDRAPYPIDNVPFPMMPAEMRNEIPEVTAMTRLYDNYSMTLMVGDRQFRQRIDSVEPNFFSVIKLSLLRGDPTRVFADPQSLVLSESAARKYFGDADPIGKIISTAANCAVTDATHRHVRAA